MTTKNLKPETINETVITHLKVMQGLFADGTSKTPAIGPDSLAWPFIGVGLYGEQINMVLQTDQKLKHEDTEKYMLSGVKGALGLFGVRSEVEGNEFDYVVVGKYTYRQGTEFGWHLREKFEAGESSVVETIAVEIVYRDGSYKFYNDCRLNSGIDLEFSEPKSFETDLFGLTYSDVVERINVSDLEVLALNLDMDADMAIAIIAHQYINDSDGLQKLAEETLRVGKERFGDKYEDEIAEFDQAFEENFKTFKQIFLDKLTD